MRHFGRKAPSDPLYSSPPAQYVIIIWRQVLHPGEHRELEAKLKEPQSRVRLEAALTQLKGAMDAKDVHYEDLSGRPKNLCAPPALLPRP